MRNINVAFFWHMHQPYYLDPLTNEFLLPWVRLHATKGYFDMVSILEDFPDIHQTINLVPSLLCQIEKYATNEATDKSLTLTLKEPIELTDLEREYVVDEFFHANWDTMIKPYPRYWELLEKRRFSMHDGNVVGHFSDRDIRDLQVWFNLTWFGYMARKKYPLIDELIEKGKYFTEHDKKALIEIQMLILKEIIPLYKRLQDKGQVELTCSPFYHPILPLLYNTDFASRAMPHCPLPEKFEFPADAKAQISQGVAYFTKLFGVAPKGMWPSEGSVCPELIPFFAECGINWIATDEANLLHSNHSFERISVLFKPHIAMYAGSKVNIIFRDRGLSDLIGFTYSKNTPGHAVTDFVKHLQNIAASEKLPEGEVLVSVILDGENAWEHYPDGGEQFFRLLYKEISAAKNIKTVCVNDFIENHPPLNIINTLHSGSWINHNYGVWIGGEEENTAWNVLRRVRMFLEEKIINNKALTKEQIEKAQQSLYIAEGSDWFWWYGDTFSSANDEAFDQLFRLHLSNIFTILGYDVPDYLKTTLIRDKAVREIGEKPIGFITPEIDGKVSHFYEWQDAGFFITAEAAGSMHQAEGYVKAVYYGFDEKHLFLRIDANDAAIFRDESLILTVNFTDNIKAYCLKIDFKDPSRYILFSSDDEKNLKLIKQCEEIKIQKIIELCLPFADLAYDINQQIDFYFEINRADIVLERIPKHRFLQLDIPAPDFEVAMWSV